MVAKGLVECPTANDLFRANPAPDGLRARELLFEAALRLLEAIPDPVAADLIQELLGTIVDRDERLAVMREVVSAALGVAYEDRAKGQLLHLRLREAARSRQREGQVQWLRQRQAQEQDQAQEQEQLKLIGRTSTTRAAAGVEPRANSRTDPRQGLRRWT